MNNKHTPTRRTAASRTNDARRTPPPHTTNMRHTKTSHTNGSHARTSTAHNSAAGNAVSGIAASGSATRASGGAARRLSGRARCILALALALVIVAVCVHTCSSTHTNQSATGSADAGASATGTATNSVSFVAVGDNLPEDMLGAYAYALGGDHYNYQPIYEFVQPLMSAADVAYVKQEVHLDDTLGVHGYPSFNAPESLADDLISVGFDMIGSASNHIYDWGYFGACARNREVWNSKNVTFAGSNLNAEEAQTIATFEKNGITFAFLDYTYGVNGYDESDLDWWEVNFISEERITSDVTRAHELADVVIVAMHWGTENFTGIDEYQEQYAQLLANLNVDIVLGSHPHVIGPVKWLDGTDGHKTLVAYSLGNFVSRHEAPDAYNELEGMLSCDFVSDGEAITIENATWTPLINHTDYENYYFRVIPLANYTAELAHNGVAMSQLDNAVEWVRTTTHEIVGDEIAIANASGDDATSEEASENAENTTTG